MSNVKISQLPEYTGNTTGTWLVMNNSGETTTYKVLLSTVLQSGTSGTSGTSGSSGSSGVNGTSGSSGTSGVNGSSGSSGTSGSSGSSGTSGSSGSSGTSGSSGVSGSSGTSGDSIFAQTGSVWNTTRNVGITGSLYVTSSYNKLDCSNGTNLLTGSINAMDASGYGNYIIAKPSTGLNILNASENQISSSIRTTLTGPTRIIGNTQITGSLIVSSSASSTFNGFIMNRTNGTNFLDAAGNGIYSFGGTGHFIGNEIFAYNGGYNIISGSANILKGTTIFTGSLNVTGSEISLFSSGSTPRLTVIQGAGGGTGSLSSNSLSFFTAGGNVTGSEFTRDYLLFQEGPSRNAVIAFERNNGLAIRTNSNIPNVNITGSVNISSVMTLAKQNPLPTGTTGSLAVSGSGLYFHNGTSWVLIS